MTAPVSGSHVTRVARLAGRPGAWVEVGEAEKADMYRAECSCGHRSYLWDAPGQAETAASIHRALFTIFAPQ